MALQIMERREDFPGVTAELQPVREYPQPLGANAAHELGYLGPVTDDELAARRRRRAGRAQRARAAAHRPDRPDRPRGAVRRRPARHAGRQDAGGRPPGRASSARCPRPSRRPATTSSPASTRRCRPWPRSSSRPRSAGPRTPATSTRAARSTRPTPARSSSWTCNTGGIVAMASYPDVRPEHLGRRHQHQGLQGDHQQEEQLPEPVARLPGRVRARVRRSRSSRRRRRSRPATRCNGTYPCPSAYPIGGTLKAQLRVRGVRHDLVAAGDRGVLRHGLLQVRLRDVAARGRRCTRRRARRTRSPRWPRRSASARRPGSTCRARPAAASPTAPGSRTTGRPPRTSTAPRPRPATPRSRKTDPQRAAYLLQLSQGELRRRLGLPRR